MFTCCPPFYQEVLLLDYCYWFFSSQGYSFTFLSSETIQGALKKSPVILYYQGDHGRSLVCPVNLAECLLGLLSHLSCGTSVLLCLFLETKIGTRCLTTASVTLEAVGKNIWNWGSLRTLGTVAPSPQSDSCLGSAHTTSVRCAK